MPEDRGDIISTGGVTPEFWKTLDDLWGSEIAGPLRKLDLVRNHKGPYHHCFDSPSAPDWDGGSSNPKMNLLEARYGPIEGVSSRKFSVWFVVKHTEDSQGQISGRGLFRVWLQFFKTENGNERRKSLIAKDIPVIVAKATRHGSDLYALLEMVCETLDLGALIPDLEGPPNGRIGPGERLVVHLKDSALGPRHRNAIWQADVNW